MTFAGFSPTPGEAIGIGAIAAVAIRESFALVRFMMARRNGQFDSPSDAEKERQRMLDQLVSDFRVQREAMSRIEAGIEGFKKEIWPRITRLETDHADLRARVEERKRETRR